ncbi:MAG: DNA-formamidopyrimidine glycosylase [Zetaproteobacteria bacterium]|nr:DNA-formamidopyrimidine glycosylase [Pseudobdellovibrionaceae bacterium]
MPELPEVECLSRAISKVALGKSISEITFHRTTLREPIPTKSLEDILINETIEQITRRSKYMLVKTKKGWGIFHLGMSGNILCYDDPQPQLPHTHVVMRVNDPASSCTTWLHYVDPRRFGLINACTHQELPNHRFFVHLGPEPLETRNLGGYLFDKSRQKSTNIKSFLMNSKIVVGVGNIYANESLYYAGLNPMTAAGSISLEQFRNLSKAIKSTLRKAIKAGGTSFRDFKNPDGNPGYFRISLQVYGRKGENCSKCSTPIEEIKISNRATYFCPNCQF